MSDPFDIFYDPTKPFAESLVEAMNRNSNVRQIVILPPGYTITKRFNNEETRPMPTKTYSNGITMTTPDPEHYLSDHLKNVAQEDYQELLHKEKTYKGSWKKRGGVGAFMMLARKWDRIESIAEAGLGPSSTQSLSNQEVCKYDILKILQHDHTVGAAGLDGTLLAEIRDLRRYLLLVEAEMEYRIKTTENPPDTRTKEDLEAVRANCPKPVELEPEEPEQLNSHPRPALDQMGVQLVSEYEERMTKAPPISEEVYYNRETKRFCHEGTHAFMGKDFQGKWGDRRNEFPHPPQPIPRGIYYNREADNFFDMITKRGQGTAFHNVWRSRASEFPTQPQIPQVSNHDEELDTHR